MKASRFTRVLCVLLTLAFCLGGVAILPVFAATEEQTSAEKALDDMRKYLASESYAAYIAKYTREGTPPGTAAAASTPDLSQSDEGAYLIDNDAWTSLGGKTEDYRAGSVWAPAVGDTAFTIEIPSTGMYYIAIEYYAVAQTVNSIERKLLIDDDLPFTEANMISLSKSWVYAYQNGENSTATTDEVTGAFEKEAWDRLGFPQDVNGNDLTPAVNQYSRWQTYFCSDSEGYSSDYYHFYLTAGTHTITLEAIREGMVVGAVRAIPTNDAAYAVPSYAEYLAAYAGQPDAPAGSSLTLEAEKPVMVSDSSVTMTNNKSSAITSPSTPFADLYNVIGANSYKSVGQWAAYNFTVPATGMYEISMRYLQKALEGMFISRTIRITSNGEGTVGKYGLDDGTPVIPFREAFNTRFNYSSDWISSPLTDGTNTFKFFFEAGVHYTIYFEVGLGALAEQLQIVEEALSVLNDCYLQILKLTGSDPDEYQDYHFNDVLPDVMWWLNKEAVVLEDVRNEFERICGGTGTHLATLENIYRLVGTMCDERQIAKNLDELKSYLGTLGTWLSDSKASTLIVDTITVESPGTTTAGKSSANFFQSAWYEIRAFFSSFFTDYDKMGVREETAESEDALQVWLASGRDQSKVVRNLIDSYFSDYCTENNYKQLPVSLKLVTGGTLLPSILAGKGPDVYMGLDSATIMNFAIRDAVLPLEEQDGFDAHMMNFHQSAIDSITLLGRTYGVPMTMSFAMMFYRLDFLVNMMGDEAKVPETWDELLSLLPILNENNMEIGLNYTLALDFFLYQNGGNMWRYIDDVEYQGAQIGLDTDEGLTAFEFCCGLYTDYSFPVSFSAATRFRTGEMPIVIQDYVSTYNQLIVYATELDGLWSFAHIPGIQEYDEHGDPAGVNYTAIAGVSSAIVTKSAEERMKATGENRIADAWQYIKWCTGAQYTSEYSNRMVSILGPSGKYAAANLNALDDMAWTSAEVAAIREQLDHLGAIVNYPGSYIIGRYTNFAFYDVVNKGSDPVEALRSYIAAINAEVTRKREEFGMKTLGTGEVPPSYQTSGN